MSWGATGPAPGTDEFPKLRENGFGRLFSAADIAFRIIEIAPEAEV
jgi:hypothetical protein